MLEFATNLSKYENVIWDWNGTLLDDTHIAIKAIQIQLERYNLPPISSEEYRKRFHFPVRDFYEELGFNFNEYSFEKINIEFLENYAELAHDVNLFYGTEEILEHLKKSGVKQFILSAAHKEPLNKMLKIHKIHHIFDDIFGLDDHLAETKIHLGRKLLETTKIDPKKSILIGDTDHDLEVGTHLGLDVLLIAQGHQSFERLSDKHHRVVFKRY